MLLYYRATLKNYLVVGTTNKTEYLLGHYDKYGDGACDIEPIRKLYKTNVKKIARSLEVPEKIIAKPPTHYLLAGFVLTDEKMMGYTFEKVDPILGKSKKEKTQKK